MTNVYTIKSSGHRHVVVITNVSTVSYSTYVKFDFLQLDVDLTTNGHEAHPTSGSQCYVFFWHAYG